MEGDRERGYFVFTFENESPPMNTRFGFSPPIFSNCSSSDLHFWFFHPNMDFSLKPWVFHFWIPFTFQSHCTLHHYIWPQPPNSNTSSVTRINRYSYAISNISPTLNPYIKIPTQFHPIVFIP